ncbi:endonuclease/exonuclease/phosphatase family protein [Streptomyces sp. NPDC048172]|uniref:endonuclease/exonuclease/phosphatase family protein n=1 Tax=Streptomyces sp. NPDC048172 TaxID=3365505 RepID=UPI00371F607C
MSIHKHWTATAALALTAALTLTACGGEGGGGGGGEDSGKGVGGGAAKAKSAELGARAGAGARKPGALKKKCDIYSQNYKMYAGHYRGTSAVPSGTADTAAGREAQCLLQYGHFSPGTIDGIFGKNSKRAMKRFQEYVNSTQHAGLKADGLPGPKSWPYLRKINEYDGQMPSASGAGERPAKAAGVVSNRVLTFNLHGPGKHKVEDQAAEIAKYKPTVFGTQETCGDKVDDFLRELKNKHGVEYYAIFRGFSHKVSQCGLFNNSYGQALFSTKPLRDYKFVKYDDSGHEGRGYVAATTEIGGKDVRVFNTHLASKDDERDERASQVRQLEGEARKHNRAVVMGDFNAQQHWPEMRPLYQHFTEADPYCGATYDGRCKPTFGKGKFDYVFLRRGAYSPPGVGVHETPHSDHRIVHADIKARF